MLSDLQAFAEALAARLNRAVAIDDPQLHLLVHTPHHGVVDAMRTRSILEREVGDDMVAYVRSVGVDRTREPYLRVPGLPDRGLLPRVCAPLRAHDLLLGYLWIIDADESLSTQALEDVATTARAVATVMHRERLLADVERERDRQHLRDLLSNDPTVRAAAGQAMRTSGRSPRAEHLQVLVVQVTGEVSPDAWDAVGDVLERAARRQGPPTTISDVRDGEGVLLLDGYGPSAVDAAAAVRAELTAQLTPAGLRTAVGSPAHGLEGVWQSWQQARLASRVATAVPSFGADVAWDDLGVYRILVHLSPEELPADAIPLGVQALLDVEATRDLARTVEAYLDLAGDARAAAEQLHLHRTSLYYRLTRFEQLTGLDLGSGGDRLAVHLGLKLARLAGKL